MKIDEIIETLQIISKYTYERNQWVQAEHDVVFLPVGNDIAISKEDEARLLELGAFRSRETDTWAFYS